MDPERFVINGDGTVTDSMTGLIWLRDASCLGNPPWAETGNVVAELGEGTPKGIDCNLTDGSLSGDWRMPSLACLEPLDRCSLGEAIGEFASIFAPDCLEVGVFDTAGTGCWTEGNPFSEVGNGYWSATSKSIDPTEAWVAALSPSGNPLVQAEPKVARGRMFPVRDGPRGESQPD